MTPTQRHKTMFLQPMLTRTPQNSSSAPKHRAIALLLALAMVVGACGSASEISASGSPTDPDTDQPTNVPGDNDLKVDDSPVDERDTDEPAPPESEPTGPGEVDQGDPDQGDSDSGEIADEAPEPTTWDSLNEAMAKWDRQNINSYEMSYQRLCNCPEELVTVLVQDGRIISVFSGSESIAPEEDEYEPEGHTVVSVFAMIGSAIEAEAYRIDVQYDAQTGRPTQVWIDPDENLADEEYGLKITDFVVRDDDVVVHDPEDQISEDMLPLCAIAEELFSMDTEPETAEGVQAMLDQMVVLTTQMEDLAPTDLAAGASVFAGFIADLRTAAEATGWDPDPFLNDNVEELMNLSDGDLIELEDFIDAVMVQCEQDF